MIDESCSMISPRQIKSLNEQQAASNPSSNSYKKYVLDVLRGKVQPLSNSDVRHTCASALLKYGRRAV